MAVDEVVDHMNFLMMAAHDTITSSATSLIWLLAKHPEWQDRLRQEIEAVTGGLAAVDGCAVVVLERGDLALGEATDDVDAEASAAAVAAAAAGIRCCCVASSCLTFEAAFLLGPLVDPFGGPRFFG